MNKDSVCSTPDYRSTDITLGELEDYIHERMAHYSGDTESNTYASTSNYYALKELRGVLERFTEKNARARKVSD